jgi:hypothetical protein
MRMKGAFLVGVERSGMSGRQSRIFVLNILDLRELKPYTAS